MNELSKSTSPYLLQHKDNPVHWREWNAETLSLAKQLNKPILVSIGYSTCHWCHVMAHESFEDELTAQIMNDFFINIKIDREERPDLDQYFMQAVQLTGVSGGWPLHAFLTSDLKVFFGGTYFPPEPKYGRPSWIQILKSIHQATQDRPDDIAKNAYYITQAIHKLTEQTSITKGEKYETSDLFEKLWQYKDSINGGFGSAPKFPNTNVLKYFLYHYSVTGDIRALDHVALSIDKMIHGGMYDHVGGAFSRYSVDASWQIPHFEKMLYDHASIMEVIALLYKYRPCYRYKFIIEQSLSFFENQLQDCGLFYSAMDADSEGHEGTFYRWTKAEIQQLLPNELSDFYINMSFVPFEDDEHFIIAMHYNDKNPEQGFQNYGSRKTDYTILENYRSNRIQPSIDTKIILAWNAMMVSTYFQLYLCLKQDYYLTKALDILIELHKFKKSDSSYFRIKSRDQYSGAAFLEDYAYLAYAYIQAYQFTGQSNYLEACESIMDQIKYHFAFENGLFSFVSDQHQDSLGDYYDYLDHSLPNANAIIAEVYRILGIIVDRPDYTDIAQSMVNAISCNFDSNTFSMTTWLITYHELSSAGFFVKVNPEELFNFKMQGMIGIIYHISDEYKNGLLACFNNSCQFISNLEEERLALHGNRYFA